MQHSVKLITIWSGPLPGYLPIYFGTVNKNPTIDFIFVADSPEPGPLPKNIQWIEMSFPGLLGYFGENIGCNVSGAIPFKMCDFKPAFGDAFKDVLNDCDFWGHIDCDVVLGDLRFFLSQDRLENYDILFFKGHGFIHGPLTLWRNSSYVNQLYQRSPWQEIFKSDQYVGFDETGKRWGKNMKPATLAEREASNEFPSITDIVYKAADNGTLRIYDENHIVETKPRSEIPYLALRWREGRLYEGFPSRPLAFFHIHWAKSDPKRGDSEYTIPDWNWDRLPNQFYITREGIGRTKSSYRKAFMGSVFIYIRQNWKKQKKKYRNKISKMKHELLKFA